jgi:hypothetical protein
MRFTVTAARSDSRGLGVALLAALVLVSPALGGGSPENALLIVDPADSDALHLANYYRAARDIPPENVLYVAPVADDYASFVEINLPAVFGTLATRDLADHIDYVIIMPCRSFYIPAPGLVSDGCSPVSRFSSSAGYTMAFIADTVAAGGLTSQNSNRYYTGAFGAYGFDSETAWYGGYPSSYSFAEQYFIGAQLGYLGERGNTVAEMIELIDRSVAADGARPTGTFYFMDNANDPARNVRAPWYNATATAIGNIGGTATVLAGVLPNPAHDCLGIMTGVTSLPFPATFLTLIPGAFCDHLTSFAGKFDTSSQTKVSAWIAQGASGSWGAVQEPCNYTGKFPHSRLHRYYYEGASLGEAALRSVEYTPFQGLLYGDPLTRRHAHLPEVDVYRLPIGPASGVISFYADGTTTHPSAAVAGFDLLIDGVAHSYAPLGEWFEVDTTRLGDGWHELRMLGYDDTLVKSTGRWVGSIVVDNNGQSTTLSVDATSGDLSTLFSFDVAAAGFTLAPLEVRLMHNGRVVAAAPGDVGSFDIYGHTFGAGAARVHAEALYDYGRIVRSAPLELDIAPTAGTPASAEPVAFGFTKPVQADAPFVVEFPATSDYPVEELSFELIEPPTQVEIPTHNGPYRVMKPLPGASGTDTGTFIVQDPSGAIDVATFTLVYDWLRAGDMNCDGVVSAADIDGFVVALAQGPDAYAALYPDCLFMNADASGNGIVSVADIDPFVALLTGGR